jgi:hypothetical protein
MPAEFLSQRHERLFEARVKPRMNANAEAP